MNKEAWLKFIKHSKEAHHLREIFNGTYLLIDSKNVQKMFFDQIDKLERETMDAHTKASLEGLREDIELEIEHGVMRGRAKVLPKLTGRPFSKITPGKIERVLNIIDTLESEIERLRDIVGQMSEEV